VRISKQVDKSHFGSSTLLP